MAGKSKPGKIHLRIVEVMKRFPDGISGGQIRHELEKEGLEPSEQTHLDRRKRDLKKWFVIKKEVATTVVDGKNRKVTLYNYAGVRRKVVDEGQIGLKERAEVIHSARVVRCAENRLRSMGSHSWWTIRSHGIGPGRMIVKICGRSVNGVARVGRLISHPCVWNVRQGRLHARGCPRPAA
jgi:hypothetical protein